MKGVTTRYLRLYCVQCGMGLYADVSGGIFQGSIGQNILKFAVTEKLILG